MSKPYYLVASLDLKVSFAEHFEIYGKDALKIIRRHGGEVLAASVDTQTLEGDGLIGKYTVIARYPSKEAALNFYNDPEYQPLIDLRQRETSNEGSVVMVDAL